MPYDLEQAAKALADNVAGFEKRTLERIGRRIKATGQLSAYDTKALENIANIGIPLNEIYADLADITAMNIKEIQTLLEANMTAEMERNRVLHTAKGVPFIEYADNEVAQQMVRHWATETAGKMINLSRTKAIGFTDSGGKFTPIEGAFQSAIDKAVVAVRTGTTDFNTAMRDTVEALGGSGVVTNYGSGVTRSLESAVRANIMYGAKKSAQEYQRYIGEKFGADGFEVDYHPHPRPSHEFMGGRMFSYDGKVTIDGLTYEDGKEALERLDDYNCHHFATPVVLGISQPRWNADELARMKAQDKEIIEYTMPNGKVITGTRYEFTQKQRNLEREIRKYTNTELEAKAAGNNTLAKEMRDRKNLFRSTYDDMCKQTGLQPTLERMQIGKYQGKTVDFNGKSGIIKENS